MQRVVFERSGIDGFRTSRTETVAIANGNRLFVGTNDGSLVLYEFRSDSVGYSCAVLETIRKQSKERKALSSLVSIESWRTCLGIMDGIVMAYDSQFYQLLASIPDSKGCHLFSVNEKNRTILVANKRKLSLYGWQGTAFSFIKDFNLVDIPKSINFVANSVVLGFKKSYECLSVYSSVVNKVLDVEKEHKMVVVELPASAFREESLLFSLGTRGIILPITTILGISNPNEKPKHPNEKSKAPEDERIEWSGLPQAAYVVFPFLVTVLADSLEIHDLGSLRSIQRVFVSSPGVNSISFCYNGLLEDSGFGKGVSEDRLAFVCNGEQMSVLKMVSINKQITGLMQSGQYEDAINLFVSCKDTLLLGSNPPVDTAKLYDLGAQQLLNQGEFGRAINHYISGETDFVQVLKQFPDLVPSSMHTSFQINHTRKLTGQVLHRAAAAVVDFCDFHRPNVLKRALRAQRIKDSGIVLDSGNSAFYTAAGVRGQGGYEDDEYSVEPEEDLKRAVLLDSVLLSALVSCHPSRKKAVVALLSAPPNFCQIESCAVLLASQGNAYTEALLWLFRSQNQHSRVLQALTEDKCVGVGAWSRDQFYQWTADYLRWLWYHAEDPLLPRQALMALRPLLHYDAELGLSVLVVRPGDQEKKGSFGGRGVTVAEVLGFLKSSQPKNNATKPSKAVDSDSVIAGIIRSTPLLTGHALAVAFLECLVSSVEAPSNMHDEFIQLLVEGLNKLKESDSDAKNQLSESDSILSSTVYREKLQNFLQKSTQYLPQRVLGLLPPQYLHENALVLSRLGRHTEVLQIYCHQMKDLPLAEQYCARIYTSHKEWQRGNNTVDNAVGLGFINNNADTLSDAGEIYLMLFQTILENLEDLSENDQEDLLDRVIRLAEKYHDRIDAAAFLELLPSTVTLQNLLRFLTVVVEFGQTKKRNLQILHQLARVQEVNVRTGIK